MVSHTLRFCSHKKKHVLFTCLVGLLCSCSKVAQYGITDSNETLITTHTVDDLATERLCCIAGKNSFIPLFF